MENNTSQIDTTPLMLDVPVDNEGNWQIELKDILSPGGHSIDAVDLQTNDTTNLGTFVIQNDYSVIERTETIIPTSVWIVLIVMAVVIAGLIGSYVRIHTKHIGKFGKEHAHRLIFVIIACLVLVGGCSYVAFVGFDINLKNIFSPVKISNEAAPVVYPTVSGTIIDPITKQGVSGVDMVVGDTAVRTTSSGVFSFNLVSADTGIKINHPNLLRTIRIEPWSDSFDIYFNTDMYATLVNIINAQARGRVDEVYDKYLDPRVQTLILLDDFIKLPTPSFVQNDALAQELVITDITYIPEHRSELGDVVFSTVVDCSVRTGVTTTTYSLAYSGGVWKLIK